jgi:hypothetical protein
MIGTAFLRCPEAATAPMKEAVTAAGDYHRMQVWAGQPAAMACSVPAGELARDMLSNPLNFVGARC